MGVQNLKDRASQTRGWARAGLEAADLVGNREGQCLLQAGPTPGSGGPAPALRRSLPVVVMFCEWLALPLRFLEVAQISRYTEQLANAIPPADLGKDSQGRLPSGGSWNSPPMSAEETPAALTDKPPNLSDVIQQMIISYPQQV